MSLDVGTEISFSQRGMVMVIPGGFVHSTYF